MAEENRRFGEKFALRMPDGMRDRIAKVAEANNRSMNAEIVARLDASFAQDEMAGVPDFVTDHRLEVLEREIANLKPLTDRFAALEHEVAVLKKASGN